MTDKVALWTAIFSAVATGFAAYATWKAPRGAATLAESLRRQAQRFDQLQKRKMKVFTVLMQERARIHSKDGVRAPNSIDIVFSDAREVRDCRSELLSAFEMRPIVDHVYQERLRKLLVAMSKDLGIADQLRIHDIERVYYPKVFQQEGMLRDIQQRQELERLLRLSATGPNSVFPPRP
jgi:hypothetical protein